MTRWLPTAALLMACTPSPPTCDGSDCAEACPILLPGAELRDRQGGSKPGTHNVLTDSEYAAFEEALADMRAGVRPWAEDSVGICEGSKGCQRFIGTSAEMLPPGNYVLWARLRAPKVGNEGDWKFTFRHICALLDPRTGELHRNDEIIVTEYGVRYEGENKAAIISPMARIRSPDSEFHRSCAWSVEFMNPIGLDKIEGSYEIPSITDLSAPQGPPGEAGVPDEPEEPDEPDAPEPG